MRDLDEALLTRRRVIQSGLLMASGCACTPWAFGLAADGVEKAGAEEAGQSWTIGNDRIARTVAFTPGTGLFTKQFRCLSTQAEFILPNNAAPSLSAEFSFVCNGHNCAGRGADFDLLSAGEEMLPNGRSLTVRLRHKELPLEVSVVYCVYDGHPALRKHLELRNTGTAALHFSHLNIEALGISLGPEDETTLLTQYGTVPRETFYTGRSEDAGLLVANGRTGSGIAVLSEVPGYMKRTEIGGWDDPDHLRIGVMYDTDLMRCGGPSVHHGLCFAGGLSQWRRLQRSALAASFVYGTGSGAARGCAGTALDLQHVGALQPGSQPAPGA
jgi:alpha-galactosidase